MPPPGDSASLNDPGAAKEYQLGVLLVHGIGTQRSGEALVRWGDVLLRTIGRATNSKVVATAGPATLDDAGSREGRAEAAVRLRAGDWQERWLFAEGRWADAFLAPTYRELVTWSLRALPWFVALHIAQGYWRVAEGHRALAKVVPATIASMKLLLALLLAPLFILLLALALLVGLLPIPQLRNLILVAQGTLAATVGDSLAFVESPMRAALIRTRVLNGLERLKRRCERTVVVAHSQGAAVVLDALGGIFEMARDGGHWLLPDAPAPGVVPDSLVTFGAGTNQLVSLKALSAGLPVKTWNNPPLSAIVSLVIVGGLSAWLYAGVHDRSTTVGGILLCSGALLLGSLALGFLAWGIERLIRVVGKRWPAVRKHATAVLVWSLVPLLLAGMVFLLIYADRTGLPFMPVSFLWLALMVLAVSLSMILSPGLRTVVTTVRMPPGVRRWIDLHASADPVPNGPTRTVDDGVPESVEISNLGSTSGDHTAYWDNLDGFVLRVVRVCAETAQSPWARELPPDTPAADERAAWRVAWHQLARKAVATTWLGLGVFLWIDYGPMVPLLLRPSAWLPAATTTALRLATLGVLIALMIWASFGILQGVWRGWVRLEQKMVLERKLPNDNAFFPLCGIGIVVWLILGLALLLVRETPSDVLAFVTSPKQLINGLLPLGGFAFASTWGLLKLLPAPRPTEAAPERPRAGVQSGS